MSDVIDADDAASARTVLGNDRLAEDVAELLRHHAAGEIDDAARRVRHDEVKGSRRKIIGAHQRHGSGA